jgi:hypothetical protein
LLIDVVWYVLGLLAAIAIVAIAWIFRRLVVLFARLEAAERIEENAPPRMLEGAS